MIPIPLGLGPISEVQKVVKANWPI
jgi:hypothetical protein